MTETSITTTTPRSGVVRHGLLALVEHMDFHSLPAFRTITFHPDRLDVGVQGESGEAWAVTLANGDGIRCTSTREGYSHFETRGLLPDSGVRVRLSWCRPAALRSVSA